MVGSRKEVETTTAELRKRAEAVVEHLKGRALLSVSDALEINFTLQEHRQRIAELEAENARLNAELQALGW